MNNRFSEDKPELKAPPDCNLIDIVINLVNQEIIFYRKRAGQVFFFGLLSEALLLVQARTIHVTSEVKILHPIAYTIFFGGVAAVGILLGREYRARIHILKTSRNELLEELKYDSVFPGKRVMSEIRVLYWILSTLSTIGAVLVWVNHCFPEPR